MESLQKRIHEVKVLPKKSHVSDWEILLDLNMLLRSVGVIA